MSLHITERQVGGVTVLDVSGRLTIDDAPQLKDKVNSLIVQHRTDIVVNLAQVAYIDSGGLGQLVASFSSVARAGGALKLLSVNQRNHDLLSITRLVTVFHTFESEPQAVASFRPAPVAAGVDPTVE